jgi:hypothetical protein
MEDKTTRRPTTAGRNAWRLSCTIKDPDYIREIKYRMADDDVSVDELLLAGIKLYMATPPKRPPLKRS